MKIIKIFLVIIVMANFSLRCEINPLSKIIITSKKAVCEKLDSKNKTILFSYLENVLVKFADESTVRCNELCIELNTTKTDQKNKLDFIDKITLKKNVCLTKENRTIKSDNAKIFPAKKAVNFWGNVEIKQNKKNKKDLPVITKCDKATLNMENKKITLAGNEESPVNTLIKLEGHPGLLKKVKTKKNN